MLAKQPVLHLPLFSKSVAAVTSSKKYSVWRAL